MKTIRLLFIGAMMLLGNMTLSAQNADKLYEEGKALYDAKKYELAFQKLMPAAEKGHKKAQYRIGRCFDKGNGVEESNKKAFAWYQKSAEQGYAKAQLQLGRCYMKGKGTTADQNKAKTWLKRAIKNPKGGDKVLANLKEDIAKGDEEAKQLLKMAQEK